MTRDQYRALNKRVIFISLLVWLFGLAVALLQPFGVPPVAAAVLGGMGVTALPVLLAWHCRRRIPHRATGAATDSTNTGEAHPLLISAEIVLLSGVLMLLLSRVAA